MSGSSSWFLTCIQISQDASNAVWYSHLFQNFPQFVEIHTVKGFSIIKDADVFLKFSCFFCNPMDVAIWSLVPLPFLNPAWTSGSSWFMYCWSLAWRTLSITLLVCEMNAIVQEFEHSLALPFFETFSSPVAAAELSKFVSAALSQYHLLGFEIAQLEFHHLY